MQTLSINPPGIEQHFNRKLLLSAIELMQESKEEYLLDAVSKYPLGCNKRNKCKEVIKIIEGLYEWKKAKEEAKKKEIIIRLISEFSGVRGKIGKIVRELNEIV